MSKTLRKIKYHTMGDWGSTDEKYLYVCFFNSCDCVGVYNEDGKYMFGWEQWDSKDMFTQLKKVIHYSPESHDEVEHLTHEEYLKLDLHGTKK